MVSRCWNLNGVIST